MRTIPAACARGMDIGGIAERSSSSLCSCFTMTKGREVYREREREAERCDEREKPHSQLIIRYVINQMLHDEKENKSTNLSSHCIATQLQVRKSGDINQLKKAVVASGFSSFSSTTNSLSLWL